MGCCALESGDAISAIPVRKLISLRGSAPPLQPRGGIMTKSKRRHPERDFTPTHPNAAAINIGSRMHVAAVPSDRDPEPVRAFGTCTGDLQRLADWFERCAVRTVAMESTGVYWIPAYEMLEQRGFEVVLVNARDAKHVPGRKTDVSDAQWLRRLHEYGLLRASFRPKGELAALRAYLRQRERLLDYSASHIQHMQKALMQMNVQLHHVVTDITGETGMRIIRAVVAGERDPVAIGAAMPRRPGSLPRLPETGVRSTSLPSDRRWSFTTPITPRSWSAICGSRLSCDVFETLQPNQRGGCRRLVIETKRPMRRLSMPGPHCMRSSAST